MPSAASLRDNTSEKRTLRSNEKELSDGHRERASIEANEF
jgi:hypothetical protein